MKTLRSGLNFFDEWPQNQRDYLQLKNVQNSTYNSSVSGTFYFSKPLLRGACIYTITQLLSPVSICFFFFFRLFIANDYGKRQTRFLGAFKPKVSLISSSNHSCRRGFSRPFSLQRQKFLIDSGTFLLSKFQNKGLGKTGQRNETKLDISIVLIRIRFIRIKY